MPRTRTGCPAGKASQSTSSGTAGGQYRSPALLRTGGQQLPAPGPAGTPDGPAPGPRRPRPAACRRRGRRRTRHRRRRPAFTAVRPAAQPDAAGAGRADTASVRCSCSATPAAAAPPAARTSSAGSGRTAPGWESRRFQPGQLRRVLRRLSDGIRVPPLRSRHWSKLHPASGAAASSRSSGPPWGRRTACSSGTAGTGPCARRARARPGRGRSRRCAAAPCRGAGGAAAGPAAAPARTCRGDRRHQLPPGCFAHHAHGSSVSARRRVPDRLLTPGDLPGRRRPML